MYKHSIHNYSMEQSPFWEVNRFSAGQNSHILRNPRVHYRFHKYPPSVPILSQMDPIHKTISHFILSSHLRLGLPSGLFPSDFPTKTLYALFLSPYVLHAPPNTYSRFCHPNNIGWGVQIIKLLTVSFSTLPSPLYIYMYNLCRYVTIESQFHLPNR
jgi:hypothetical protein